ncbi:MAG: hypothetical protein MUC88_29270 [Planctomycetes bacterium]|jgi:hypothetical protein|nr:hypothetical protein [Planctomycetota bacterium]
MIIKPGMRIFYVTPNVDGDGVFIGEMDRAERFVDVPLADLPQLIKRLREVSRAMRAPVDGAEEQE